MIIALELLTRSQCDLLCIPRRFSNPPPCWGESRKPAGGPVRMDRKGL